MVECSIRSVEELGPLKRLKNLVILNIRGTPLAKYTQNYRSQVFRALSNVLIVDGVDVLGNNCGDYVEWPQQSQDVDASQDVMDDRYSVFDEDEADQEKFDSHSGTNSEDDDEEDDEDEDNEDLNKD